MNFLGFGLNQKCTYWERTGVNGYNEPTFADPVVLDCRWEDRVEKIQNHLGEEYTSTARIFLQDDVKPGGYLALGEVTSFDPRTTSGASQIMSWRKIPSLDGTFFERKAYL